MSIGSDIGGAEETVDMVAVLTVLAVLGYAVYKFPSILSTIKDDLNTAFGGIFSNPGGGETAGTAETYTGAVNETASDPLGTLGAIIGYTPDAPEEIPQSSMPPTTPGLPPGYDPSTGTIDQNLVYNGATSQ